MPSHDRLRGGPRHRQDHPHEHLSRAKMKLSAWALVLAGSGLVWSGCERVAGTLPPNMNVPVNERDLEGGHCINTCQPDYGSEPVRCEEAERGLEFFPGGPTGGVAVSEPVWDFEWPD